ncbi:MAG: hypothetical protein HN377_02610 [Alphaproteobacteria bacterium]|nr:hypothetical protein [Alphaproteobacteria bacterium]
MKKAVMILLAALFVGNSALAAVDDPGIVRVNSVVVAPAASVGEAEAAAKREALQRVIGMRGNLQIRDADVRQIMSEVNGIVQTRHVLNANAVGGRYQPAFYFNVGMDRIDEIIQQADAGDIAALGEPRIQAAIVIRRLPKAFSEGDDREVYIDDLNETVKEYYGRAGFSLVDFLNFDEEELYSIKRLKSLEKKVFNPANPPTAIDFYLLGQLDIPNDSVKPRDGGAYWRANAKLQIKLLDLNSGQPVSSSRTVEGTGQSARESIDDAIRNVVKAIQQKASAPDILKTWNRNIQTGMKYEITFCEKGLKYEYFNNLAKHLEQFGKLSGGKSDQVPLYVFQFPGGKMIDPAKEFERMLGSVQGSTGKYEDTSVSPIIYKKHKVFMFGNSPNCFGGGRGQQAVQ